MCPTLLRSFSGISQRIPQLCMAHVPERFRYAYLI
jgi:hypothetical protein